MSRELKLLLDEVSVSTTTYADLWCRRAHGAGPYGPAMVEHAFRQGLIERVARWFPVGRFSVQEPDPSHDRVVVTEKGWQWLEELIDGSGKVQRSADH